MTYEVYLVLFPKLWKGIHEMAVVREHKDWWCVWILDRFGSHVNVQISKEIFIEHKILIVKEEGNTSQVYQSYDQWFEKADKLLRRIAPLAVSVGVKNVVTNE